MQFIYVVLVKGPIVLQCGVGVEESSGCPLNTRLHNCSSKIGHITKCTIVHINVYCTMYIFSDE